MLLFFSSLWSTPSGGGGGPTTLSVPASFHPVPIPIIFFSFPGKAMLLSTLYPANDWACKAKLKDIDILTGDVNPLLTGPVRAFLALTGDPSAGPADVSLDVQATHLGDGIWLILFDASLLDPTLLATLFTTTPPVLIVEYANGFRATAVLTYTAIRPAVIA